MGAPYPPTGEQTQHTERPLKVYAEQYQSGHPVPVGAVVDPIVAGLPLYSDGLPRVFLPTGPHVVALGDWVISNRYTGKPIEVISNDEFTERFGTGGPPADIIT